MLKSLFSIGYYIKGLFVWLRLLLAPLGRFLFSYVFLPIYGKYLWLKSKVIKVAPEKKDRLLIIFTNRFLIHFLILIIGSGVVISNIMAYEGKEDYGQNALVYKLAGLSVGEIISDTNVIADEAKNYNYQQQGTFVEGRSFADNTNADGDNILTDQATTIGDMALVKPDIINNSTEFKSNIARIIDYTVIEGDTISRIASRFGVSVNTILWANNLSFSSYVKPGQKIIVPSMSGIVYKVAKGDTISKIGSKYGISSDKITEANALTAEGLVVGNLIIVPGAKIIETAKPRAIASTPAKTPARPAASSAVSGTGRMQWPSACQRISQYYKGWLHTGVDIACPWGTSLRAADGGRVIRVQYGRTGYGYNVMIDHGGGIVTLYGHMSSIDVVNGQYVEKGEIIGAEGSTGRSTGPHVHFEVRINGSFVNPLSYIR